MSSSGDVRANAVDTSYRHNSSQSRWTDERPSEKRSKFTRVLTNQPAQCSNDSDGYVARSEFQQLMDCNQKLLNELELCRNQLTRVEAVKNERPNKPLLQPDQFAFATQGPSRSMKSNSSRAIGFDVSEMRPKRPLGQTMPIDGGAD